MSRRLDATRAHRSRARFDRLPSSLREQAIVKATPAEEPFTKIVSGVFRILLEILKAVELPEVRVGNR